LIFSTSQNPKLQASNHKQIKEEGERKNKIKMSVDVIQYTTTAALNADLMSESSIAPFKEADCRIYEVLEQK
jgi:hypothetical protein